MNCNHTLEEENYYLYIDISGVEKCHLGGGSAMKKP